MVTKYKITLFKLNLKPPVIPKSANIWEQIVASCCHFLFLRALQRGLRLMTSVIQQDECQKPSSSISASPTPPSNCTCTCVLCGFTILQCFLFQFFKSKLWKVKISVVTNKRRQRKCNYRVFLTFQNNFF